jgi:transketolase
VASAFAAAELLAQARIECRVLSVHTIKPLDHGAVLAAARETRAVVTVEEHSVNGGLGEACAALLLQSGLVPAFRIVGFPDEATVNGNQKELFRHYGLDAEGLATTARELLATRG